MPEATPLVSPNHTTVNYEALIRFLIQPFLDAPDALKVDCEVSPNKPRIWVRVAFEGEDKGRVFGRGGRNIQAIRTVLAAVGNLSGVTVHLDVYGSSPSHTHGDGDEGEKHSPRRPPKRRAPSPSH